MEPNNGMSARQSAGCDGEIGPQILLRELYELVAVFLGKGRASLQDVRIRRHSLQRNASLGRHFEKVLHSCGGEDQQYSGLLCTRVQGLGTTPRGITMNEPAGAAKVLSPTRTVSSPSRT
jgi:hypothetical protein